MEKIDNDMSYEPDAGSLSAFMYQNDVEGLVTRNLMIDYDIDNIEVVVDFDWEEGLEEFFIFGGLLRINGKELQYLDIEDWGDLKEAFIENLVDYFKTEIEKRSGKNYDSIKYETGGLAGYIINKIEMEEDVSDININDVEYIGHSNDSGLSFVNVKIDIVKQALYQSHNFDKINLNLSFELDGKKYNKTFKGDAFDVAVEAEEYLEKSFFN